MAEESERSQYLEVTSLALVGWGAVDASTPRRHTSAGPGAISRSAQYQPLGGITMARKEIGNTGRPVRSDPPLHGPYRKSN